MHSGRSGLADPKSRQHRSSIRDQIDPRDDSRSNKSEALSVLSTWESAAMVSFSTTAHGAKLGVLEERVHDGVLLAGQDPDSAQQDCNIRASPDGDYCGSL